MKILVLQHVLFEGLGSIGSWIRKNGHQVHTCYMFSQEPTPDVCDYDWVITLGGPMSVNDEKQYPWLVQEKRLIDTAVLSGKIVLGICLGAQLIASVLGKRVSRSSEPEIGWHLLKMTPDAKNTPLFSFLPDQFLAFHWHGETFETPSTAVPLASSKACPNQGYLYNRNVVGLQFHLETTFEAAEALTRNCADEMVPGPYIQSTEAILSDQKRFTGINRYMGCLLDRMAATSQPDYQQALIQSSNCLS